MFACPTLHKAARLPASSLQCKLAVQASLRFLSVRLLVRLHSSLLVCLVSGCVFVCGGCLFCRAVARLCACCVVALVCALPCLAGVRAAVCGLLSNSWIHAHICWRHSYADDPLCFFLTSVLLTLRSRRLRTCTLSLRQGIRVPLYTLPCRPDAAQDRFLSCGILS